MKPALRTLTALISLPLIFFALSLLGALIPGPHAQNPGPPAVQIGLLRGPIHYDFLLPLNANTLNSFAFSERAGVPITHPDARWLIIGWGATGFYTTAGSYADITAPVLWDGITGDTSVMHIDVGGEIPTTTGVTFLKISEAEFKALLATIESSFARNAEGGFIPLAIPGFRDTDAFFAARGHFNLLHTCNAWIGETLRAAGLPFGIWTPTPQSVALSLGQNL